MAYTHEVLSASRAAREYLENTARRRIFDELSTAEKEQGRQDCLKTLYFEEYNAGQSRVIRGEDNTGDWISTNRTFKAWDESPHSKFLWLRGNPGSGKSTLMKRVLDKKTAECTRSLHLKPEKSIASEEEYEDDVADDRDIIVASFFYFKGGRTGTSHVHMLRSLLYQILKANSKVFPHFLPKYGAFLRNTDRRWHQGDLISLFNSLLSVQFQLTIYIIVDAMDESEGYRRSAIFDLLLQLCSLESACTFKVLIACGPCHDIRSFCNKGGNIDLSKENRGDMEIVINKGIRPLTDRWHIPRNELERVTNCLIDHSNGVFLWISIALKELQGLETYSEGDLIHLLESLPIGLEDLYWHIVEKLNTSRTPCQILERDRIGTWTSYGERFLTIRELGDAVIMPSDPGLFTPSTTYSETRISNLETRIACDFGGFLEVLHNGIVQPVHPMTRNFIFNKSRGVRFFNRQGDSEIALVCLRYLRLICHQGSKVKDCSDFIDKLSDLPLLNYILAFLPTHLKQFQLSNNWPQILEDEWAILIQTFGESPRSQACDLLERWCEEDLGRPIGIEIDKKRAKQSRIAMLVTAARAGQVDVMRALLKAYAKFHHLWHGLTPLGEAAAEGHEAVMLVFMIRGADPNFKDDNGDTPLLKAAAREHEAVVRLLLKSGADPNVKNKSGQTPLIEAALQGNVAMVRLLLKKGADPDHENTYKRTPLSYAAETGHAAVVEILLENGVNPSIRDTRNQTPLSKAANNGSKAVVRLLLEKGADPNSADDNGNTPLLKAAAKGHEAVVRLLLKSGADQDLRNNLGQTPLSGATAKGHKVVVWLLLEKSAERRRYASRLTHPMLL